MTFLGKCRPILGLFLVVSLVLSQEYSQDYPDYQDYADSYEQDNLYTNYAAKQQDKQGGGGGGMGKLVVASAAAWFLGGKIHSGRATKKLKAKFQKEQKQLYSQYYNDVYKLTEQNQELQYMAEQLQDALKQTEAKHELEAIQRDYDEFKQPDIDGDDRISRAEFNMYVNNYLKNYPGLAEKDYPKFEDFDHDGDGFVSFQEYAQQMALQVQQAEMEQHYAQQSGGSGRKETAKAQALNDMYKGTASAGDMYANYR
eukprot:CAMPEP_0195258966 /NCGR_PEP_ID=MMETSP0706-20130129/7688_1 /TAXON_ID=33640 /ORGANISM="Asterionellopsis glacialis, Strain CCMP134" /LENGTH=255 /DNA_ID=CAMNT_0040312385 /DNA_START=24 /DNA_END=791 /DNA_ORIENTATION=+